MDLSELALRVTPLHHLTPLVGGQTPHGHKRAQLLGIWDEEEKIKSFGIFLTL